jgi:DNA-binding NtrC family response regulator
VTALDLSFPPPVSPAREPSRAPRMRRIEPPDGDDAGQVLVRAVCMAMRAAVFRMIEPPPASEVAPMTFQDSTRRFQRALLLAHLGATGWNVARTARRLDLARSHVYNLMESMQIERPANARSRRQVVSRA